MNRTKTTILTIITVALTILASCNRKTVYYNYAHTPTSGWKACDTLLYNIEPIDESGIYTRQIELRLNHSYPYRNLSLIAEQTIHTTDSTSTDTVNIMLATDEPSEQLKKTAGVSYNNYAIALPEKQFSQGDSISIRICHNMKQDTIAGITDIGIKIRKK